MLAKIKDTVPKKKIYFAASIRGGRSKVDNYLQILNYLKENYIILDEHVANIKIDGKGEKNLNTTIYKRDIKWLKECDFLIAEVTTPSLGVGYEIAYAENLNKKVICLYEDNTNLSAMISGNPNIILVHYHNFEDLKIKLFRLLN